MRDATDQIYMADVVSIDSGRESRILQTATKDAGLQNGEVIAPGSEQYGGARSEGAATRSHNSGQVRS